MVYESSGPADPEKERQSYITVSDINTLCTVSENQFNFHRCRKNKTEFRGVHENKRGVFEVAIGKNKRIWVGTFKTAEEAGSAYLVAARRELGLNKQVEGDIHTGLPRGVGAESTTTILTDGMEEETEQINRMEPVDSTLVCTSYSHLKQYKSYFGDSNG